MSWLQSIVADNDAQLKRDMVAINRRLDRISRKLDYWDRRATFYLEGKIKGAEFRFNRWKQVQETKQRQVEAQRKAARARKRIGQIKDLLKLLEGIGMGTGRSRERGLVRSREVEGWVRPTVTRDRGRGRRREQ